MVLYFMIGFIMATRSSRRKPPLQDAQEHAVKALDKTEELEVQFMNSLKGRGVFAKAFFRKGDFVVEYRGELINSEESKRRRMTYHKASAVFMFDFCWKEDLWCIDASVYDGSLGRLVNADDRHPNCQMKRVIAKDKPHLCLFALRDIQPGEEITFDLGEKAGPQSKQDLDEPEVLSSDKVGLIPPPHLVELSDSNESQNPCTSSSQLNGNSQKTKEQMELDSDKLLDPSLDGSSKEYITKREDVHMYSDQDRDPEEPGDAEPAYESDTLDIQQLISDEEELHPLHGGCSSLEHEDPLPPRIKEEQKHPQLPHIKEEEDPQLPHVKKEQEDPQLSYVKVEEEDPQPPHVEEEEIDPKLPNIKEEQKHPQPAHIHEEEEDPKLPHVKEEEEELGVSKLPLTGGSVKCKQEKPLEGSELHHHSPSKDHCGGPPPDNLMAPLSDSDKVSLTRDKDCKGMTTNTWKTQKRR
ncbi:involucrin-like [Phyllopteryx taeniolatus]|uniref:involucrin-like n=1 Tax=Phyllopteryx taeniolatus TaxID=161469 RepID=UPI002AD4867F|nr:involucrin-like [Phyllopteryx taeniolatus]